MPTDTLTGTDQSALATALMNPAVYGLPATERIEKLETHISYVFLAGEHAFKIKKAVALGFLDFRTLNARRFYCDEELRLNRRFAPNLYLEVVPICGQAADPILGGDNKAVEYAVKMRRFSQNHLLDRLLARGELRADHIDRLAAVTASFHARATAAAPADTYGTPSAVREPAMENFPQIRAATEERSADLDALARWTIQESRALEVAFRSRKQDGFIRECHGDLHLRNVALVDGEVTLFDCIEFDPNLRWIDVMNDAAFMVMDLYDRRQPAFARRFLNRYLEITGDYGGLRVLRFYIVYRALVRAKIHCLRAVQPGISSEERTRLFEQYNDYVTLARACSDEAKPALVITHGLSGSGKTAYTESLLEAIGAVRVRSDIERKRLQGLEPTARTQSAVGAGLYAADISALTYQKLLALATIALEAGYAVVVDATFLKCAQRNAFRELAQTRGVPFAILDVVADEAILRARIAERQRRNNDASEADTNVLAHQISIQEPLQPDERPFVVTYDCGKSRNATAVSVRSALEEKLRID